MEKTVKKHVPLTGRCPGWLIVENDLYQDIPERVATIRLIFEWFNNGYGLKLMGFNQKVIPISRNKVGLLKEIFEF